MNRDKGIDLEVKVMKRIKDEKISFRSKYVFLAKKLGLGGGFILSLVLAILFFNLTFFTMKASGNLEFLSFGRRGILAFLQSFPYHWILIGLAFFLVSSTILSRYDISYKKPFKVTLSVLIVLIFIAGIALAISGINGVIEGKVVPDRTPILCFLYRRMEVACNNGLVGEVIEIRSDGIVVETSGKKEVFVELTEDTLLPTEQHFRAGNHICVVGRWEKENFCASALRVMGESGKTTRIPQN